MASALFGNTASDYPIAMMSFVPGVQLQTIVPIKNNKERQPDRLRWLCFYFACPGYSEGTASEITCWTSAQFVYDGHTGTKYDPQAHGKKDSRQLVLECFR